MKEINKKHHQTFAGIRQQVKNGNEYWSARDLGLVLEYSSWQNFEAVIRKAIESCNNAGITPSDHFNDLIKMVELGSGAVRRVRDYHLSRYACYLIVQNADPSKPVIAAGQTYFAIQTRRQELADDQNFQKLDEDQKRVLLRQEMRKHNKQLMEVANRAGVESGLDFAVFQNHGYQGLYGGLDARDIHQKKGLKKSQQILDHMGTTELAANLFRATQTEEKLERENIQGKDRANQTHYQVGAKVRETIKDLGGTVPEKLPTPKTGVKALESKGRKKLKSPEKKGGKP